MARLVACLSRRLAIVAPLVLAAPRERGTEICPRNGGVCSPLSPPSAHGCLRGIRK